MRVNFFEHLKFSLALFFVLVCQLALFPGLDQRLAFLNLPLLWVIWLSFKFDQAKLIKLVIIGLAIDVVSQGFSFQLWVLLLVVLTGSFFSRHLTNATLDFFYRILGLILIQAYYLFNLILTWFFGHWQNLTSVNYYLSWSVWLYFTVINYLIFELVFQFKHWRKKI